MSKNAVFYIVEGSHTQLLSVSLVSLADHYESTEPLDIYIYMENPTDSDRQCLESLPEVFRKSHIQVKVMPAPEVRRRLKQFDMFWPNMVMWKLFIPLYLNDYDKVLYLDNDTIVETDVSQLFEQIASTDLIAAVPDFYFYVESDNTNYGPNFGIENTKNYINVGMLVFNISQYIAEFDEDGLVDKVNSCNYQFPEQTLMNIMCEGRITLLPLEYNYQKNDYWLFSWARYASPSAALDIVEAREKIAIRHFVGYQENSSPWEHLGIAEQQEMVFWDYLYQVKRFLYEKIHNKSDLK